jgi:hypothetical protein
VVASDVDPGFVAGHIVDAIGNGLADGVAGEVVDQRLFGPVPRLPFASTIPEVAYQLLLLRIDGDHRLIALLEFFRRRIDQLELRVPVGM